MGKVTSLTVSWWKLIINGASMEEIFLESWRHMQIRHGNERFGSSHNTEGYRAMYQEKTRDLRIPKIREWTEKLEIQK